MSGIEFVDRHEAKIRSITMEAPEGYEFGHIVKAEIELRVGKLEYTTDKEGNYVRTAVLVIEGAHIKEHLDPATAFASGPQAVPDPDDDDSDDDSDTSSNTVTTPDGREVEVGTGVVEQTMEPETEPESEPVSVGAGVDPEVGF